MFARNILAQKVCPTTEIRVLELNGCIFDSGRPPRSIFSGRPRTDRPSKSFFLSKNKENCLILEPFFFVYLGSQMKLLLFGIPNKIAFVWDPKQNCFCLGLQIKSRFSHTAPRSPSIVKVFIGFHRKIIVSNPLDPPVEFLSRRKKWCVVRKVKI